jgi:hypothetical protein
MLRLLATALIPLCLSHGAIITDSSQIPSPTRTINFVDFASPLDTYTQGPLEVATGLGFSVVYSSTNPDGGYVGSASYDLGVNGQWGGSQTYASVNFDLFGGDAYSMVFKFSLPMRAVAALMNYRVPTQEEIDLGIVYADVIIEALDSGGTILESYNLNQEAPISTPGGSNVGAIRGILRGSADIYGFRLSNAGVLLTDLTLSADEFPPIEGNPPLGGDIPEPGTWMLVGAGLASAAFLRRR